MAVSGRRMARSLWSEKAPVGGQRKPTQNQAAVITQAKRALGTKAHPKISQDLEHRLELRDRPVVKSFGPTSVQTQAVDPAQQDVHFPLADPAFVDFRHARPYG